MKRKDKKYLMNMTTKIIKNLDKTEAAHIHAIQSLDDLMRFEECSEDEIREIIYMCTPDTYFTDALRAATKKGIPTVQIHYGVSEDNGPASTATDQC